MAKYLRNISDGHIYAISPVLLKRHELTSKTQNPEFELMDSLPEKKAYPAHKEDQIDLGSNKSIESKGKK